jgi:hypothetical protein
MQSGKRLMFQKEDFKVDSIDELLAFAPIFVFVGLVAPFVAVAYKLGAVMYFLGILEEPA